MNEFVVPIINLRPWIGQTKELQDHVVELRTFVHHLVDRPVHVYLHYVYSLTYRVRILQIFKGSLFAKQLPVHNHREVHIKNDIVVDSQTKNQSNQGKLTICLK